ncbi:MAG: DUF3788 domain-containing protein [Bacteroidetes bacterium]|nr:DUF3788 domain-containing protein [Bacteroidota bacterium]
MKIYKNPLLNSNVEITSETLKNILKPLLSDPNVKPTNKMLKNILGKSYSVFEELSAILTNEKYSLTLNWNYHKNIIGPDTSAWYCRVMFKKKTTFWLSISEGYFVITFFFLVRHLAEINQLETSKNSFIVGEEFSRDPKVVYFPLVFTINSNEQFNDLLKIVDFKKRLK